MLDQVFLLDGEETTIREQCRAGLVTLVRYRDAPYAYIMRPSFSMERLPISEADYQTLEQELHDTALKRTRQRKPPS